MSACCRSTRFSIWRTVVGSGILDAFDALSTKQERLRINVARRAEAAGFLGAAARVGPVHKAALVVHEAGEIAPGARQALTEIVRRHLPYLAPHGVAGAEDFTAGKNQPLPAVQAAQHPRRTAGFGLFDQEPRIHGTLSGSGKSPSGVRSMAVP